MTQLRRFFNDLRCTFAILLIANVKYKKNVKRNSNMKRNKMFFVLTLILFLMSGSNKMINAQNPPPPPGQHNLAGDQPPQGGNAPIGAGAALLVVMGIVYGLSRIPGLRKDPTE